MLPVAHVDHYLWVLYLLPVAIVVAGIFRNAVAQRRLEREEEKEG